MSKLSLNTPKGLWPVFFLVLMLKYAYYGYRYLPIVDDNNMYGIYRLYENTFQDVILHYKMFTTRPVAAFLDAYFWAHFWDMLGLALFVMSLLLFVTCYLLHRVFEKSGLGIGLSVLIIFALLPFGSEATYWLSASTRIVVGMFFTALSLYLLCLYIDAADIKTGRFYGCLFFAANLISYSFYEQTIVLSFIGALLVIAASWRSIKSKYIALIPFLNLGIIGFWYKAFSSHGNMAIRGQLVKGDIITHFSHVTAAIREVWRLSIKDFLQVGFKGGFRVIISNHAYWFLLAALAGSIFLSLIAYHENFSSRIRLNMLKLFLGVLLFSIPFAPFYPINQIWICNRNLFTSFIGLGLMIESLLNMLARNKWLAGVRSLAIGIVALTFLVANVYELAYYQRISTIDREIVSRIMMQPGIERFSNNKQPLFLLNSKPSYINTISKRVENCTGADWALLGAIKAQHSLRNTGYAYPIPDKTASSYRKEDLGQAVFLGVDHNRNVFPLKIIKQTGNIRYLSTLDGKEFGKLEQMDENTLSFHLY